MNINHFQHLVKIDHKMMKTENKNDKKKKNLTLSANPTLHSENGLFPFRPIPFRPFPFRPTFFPFRPIPLRPFPICPFTTSPNIHLAQWPFCPIFFSPIFQFAQKPSRPTASFRPMTISPYPHFTQ